MSKIFIVTQETCYYDATHLYKNAADAKQYYPMTLIIIDTPDYVCEGWGYDGTKTGDERFIEPQPYVENSISIEEQLADAQAALQELGVEKE